MRKTILIVNFLALCTLSLAANFVFSPVDTQAQSSQAAEQQADRGGSQLAPQTSDIRAGRGTYFAVVRHNGVLVRGTEVVSATRVGPGNYRVTFNSDISKCGYTATLSEPFYLGVIQVEAAAEMGFDPRQVNVYTANQTFQSYDMGFHLIVNCS